MVTKHCMSVRQTHIRNASECLVININLSHTIQRMRDILINVSFNVFYILSKLLIILLITSVNKNR